MFWSPVVVGTEAIRVAYQASKSRKRGAAIVLIGAVIYFFAAFILFPPVGIKPSGPWFHLFYTTETLSLLIALSCYLAFEFAFTNQSLIQSLREIKQLSEEKEQNLLLKNAELESALLEGQTAERKRVAADLHDNLSSMLTAVRWNLMALNKNNLNESEHKAYDDILAMTTTAHDQVRLISHNLLPEELEKEGLTTALERLVNKLNRSGAVHFDLTITHLAERLSKKTEFELYSLELTHNVIKHSEATEAEISLIQQDKCIHLIVSDNGKGLDENRQNGMGIQNVESRIKSLNGKWTISSQEGKGVVFEAEFG
jgi:signal transduction histidine kinase